MYSKMMIACNKSHFGFNKKTFDDHLTNKQYIFPKYINSKSPFNKTTLNSFPNNNNISSISDNFINSIIHDIFNQAPEPFKSIIYTLSSDISHVISLDASPINFIRLFVNY